LARAKQFISRLEKNLPLVIFGDYEQTKDFAHVQDGIEANMLALKNAGISEETFIHFTSLIQKVDAIARTNFFKHNDIPRKLRSESPTYFFYVRNNEKRSIVIGCLKFLTHVF